MRTDRDWSRSTVSGGHSTVAVECLKRLRSKTSTGEFGYRMQALAAHVLLGLKHRVEAINARGHPDIVSFEGGQEFRFEVEAEVIGVKKPMLSSSDFAALMKPGVAGFFAFAVRLPRPRWIVVPAHPLSRRKRPASRALLEALSDKTFSADWTRVYLSMIERSCREVLDRSFDQLSQRAIDGRAL